MCVWHYANVWWSKKQWTKGPHTSTSTTFRHCNPQLDYTRAKTHMKCGFSRFIQINERTWFWYNRWKSSDWMSSVGMCVCCACVSRSFQSTRHAKHSHQFADEWLMPSPLRAQRRQIGRIALAHENSLPQETLRQIIHNRGHSIHRFLTAQTRKSRTCNERGSRGCTFNVQL